MLLAHLFGTGDTSMAAHESKVVAFEMPQAKPKDSAKLNVSRIAAECRAICAERLSALLETLFARVDDELFKLSDRAENNTLQSLYFEAMRYVRRERDAIQGEYLRSLLQRYDEFWQDKPARNSVQPAEAGEQLDRDNFSLVDNEILEEDLAVNSMIGKGNTLFHHELFALNKRLAALTGRPEEQIESNNPMAPAALCRGFESAIKPRALDLRIKLLIYKLFDRMVLGEGGTVYRELNALLVKAGILPSIARSVKRHPASLADNRRVDSVETDQTGARSHTVGEQSDSAAYLEAFKSMQSLLDSWRSQLGLPVFSPEIPGGAIMVDSTEVLNALSSLQHPATVGAAGGSGAFTDGLRVSITNQLGKLQADGQARSLGRLEGDIIDMVAMIFDFILEDRNLSDPVKALIARLQIPVVKVAILDNSFFAKKNHPTRVLLNTLAQAGIGLDVADSNSDNPVFKKIEAVVGRILHEFDRDGTLFGELLEEFSEFMEKESQRSRLAEERTRQVTQSKDQVRLAKKQVAYEIALRLRGKEVPPVVGSFLYNVWKDVLVLAYLRRDKESADWHHALAVMDELILSILPPADTKGRQEILSALPSLWKAVREGLESISFDPHQVMALLKDLETCCSANPPPQTQGEPARHAVGRAPSLFHAVPGLEVVIKDPELAEAILDIKSELSDAENRKAEEVEARRMIRDIVQESPRLPHETEDESFITAQALRIGEWLEFIDEEQKPWRAKLSWKSQVTPLYVFVNRKGVKVAEMNVRELASRLRLGTARVIEGSTAPLMDRALAALVYSLKNPPKKAVTPD
jgi:hypothetical protein